MSRTGEYPIKDSKQGASVNEIDADADAIIITKNINKDGSLISYTTGKTFCRLDSKLLMH